MVNPPALTGDPEALLADGPTSGPFDDDLEEVEAEKAASKRRAAKTVSLFAEASAEEKAREEQRKQDRQVGLLIGPKNLERLRAFGFDVSRVSDQPLTPGTAHRGLTE